MITLGAKFGGPEEMEFREAWKCAATAIREARHQKKGEPEDDTPGVNVVFYVSGSVIEFSRIKEIEPARFSRKRKLLLVDVPAPKNIRDNFDKSLSFIMDSLGKANAIAVEVFERKGAEPFDLAKANAIVDQAKQLLSKRVRIKK